MSEIVEVAISQIEPNPFRLLKKYPFVESKLDALKRSMQYDDVGCWEGIIARKSGKHYEQAFGHHRVEAAKQIGLKHIPLIIRDLTDKQMLQFMGRENLDDYTVSFSILLETWEAADVFSCAQEKRNQPIDIARLLGWVRVVSGNAKMTDAASACYSAHQLIAGGYLNRSDLVDLSTSAARHIVERAYARIKDLERIGEMQNRPKQEVERAKQHIAKGAKETVRKVRDGSVANKNIRSEVDVNSYRYAKDAKRVSPLFDAFGKALAENISRMINADANAEKLEAVVTALDKIELDSDLQIVDRITFEIGGLAERAHKWHQRLTKKPGSVSKFKLLGKGE